MTRHGKPPPLVPGWVMSEDDDCVRSVAEEAYLARQLALAYGAGAEPRCKELIASGDKSLPLLADRKASSGKRSAAGNRAMGKFWEAKTCARRHGRADR